MNDRDEQRAADLGLSVGSYFRWRAGLREDYRRTFHVPSRLSRYRGTVRAWMAPGSDQTTTGDEAAA